MTGSPHLRALRALVVDDDRFMLDVIALVLADLGLASVHTVASGSVALEHLRSAPRRKRKRRCCANSDAAMRRATSTDARWNAKRWRRGRGTRRADGSGVARCPKRVRGR